jgi:rhodanese-related sulfurtransferase
VALALRRHGVTGVRPLAGGFTEWRHRGFPLQPVVIAAGGPERRG